MIVLMVKVRCDGSPVTPRCDAEFDWEVGKLLRKVRKDWRARTHSLLAFEGWMVRGTHHCRDCTKEWQDIWQMRAEDAAGVGDGQEEG